MDQDDEPKKGETNFYNPDESEEDEGSGTSGPKNLAWTASEYIEHQRGASWYILLFVGTVIIAAVTYIITRDYFATGVIPVLGIIMAFFVGHKPQQVTYELNSSGLKINGKLYYFSTYKSFSITRGTALSSLNLYPIKRFGLDISAFFESKDEDAIASLVGEHLPMEERGPDKIDRLTRKLKI